MEEPIEESYFNWLYAKVVQIRGTKTPSNSYLTLMRDLHSTEFVWLLSGDDNRAADGLDLRKEFIQQAYLDFDPPWMNIPCSVLEMFIAFSRRAEFDTDIGSREWFWIFLQNLGLSDLTDATRGVTELVNEVLYTFVWRLYDRKGNGGMFPLSKSKNDQRKIEVYYQFCEWVTENDIF